MNLEYQLLLLQQVQNQFKYKILIYILIDILKVLKIKGGV